ncbi:MAG TPA: PfkB family carbohydrate kinase [Deltaproteobacteria bacterium]|nr:PfkB family carbohydrate kinase [Deltaproteobacteria bacterium]HPR55092.1 PfkB family carbohydrate kinase [Deltaproteobacteria bacterium]HXK48459.1 PfkB family carbohydrate kinase [Deltaproteobacteria bacterium]
MGNAPFDVVVVGRACVDHLCVVDAFPAEDAKVPFSLRIVEGGGQGATAACCAARLGGRVAYVGCVGDDGEGAFCLQRLHACGVDTSHVRVIPGGHTPMAYVFITAPTGRRTIIYEPGTLPAVEYDEGLAGLLAGAKAVLLGPQATNLAIHLRGLGGLPPIVYDCERSRPGLEEMMAAADYFVPPSAFLHRGELPIEGSSESEKIISLSGMVCGRLIVTDGEHGAVYLDGDALVRVPVPPVGVKDTTGAGDNFHGAFALALSRGFGLAEAVRFSVAVASLSCREYGGRAGIPDEGEALEAMRGLAPVEL